LLELLELPQNFSYHFKIFYMLVLLYVFAYFNKN
jgi:hypothetical protein